MESAKLLVARPALFMSWTEKYLLHAKSGHFTVCQLPFPYIGLAHSAECWHLNSFWQGKVLIAHQNAYLKCKNSKGKIQKYIKERYQPFDQMLMEEIGEGEFSPNTQMLNSKSVGGILRSQDWRPVWQNYSSTGQWESGVNQFFPSHLLAPPSCSSEWSHTPMAH